MKVATRSIMTFLSHDFFNSRTLMHAGYTLILPAGYVHAHVLLFITSGLPLALGIWVKKGREELERGLVGVCHTLTICRLEAFFFHT